MEIKDIDLKNSKGQTLLFLKSRSILSNISQIQADFMNTNLVALCLSQTWLTKATVDGLITLDGYQII